MHCFPRTTALVSARIRSVGLLSSLFNPFTCPLLLLRLNILQTPLTSYPNMSISTSTSDIQHPVSVYAKSYFLRSDLSLHLLCCVRMIKGTLKYKCNQKPWCILGVFLHGYLWFFLSLATDDISFHLWKSENLEYSNNIEGNLLFWHYSSLILITLWEEYHYNLICNFGQD